jgi:mRNA-degrading endonuclease toxin of MazEF toxin-antitoxin module
LDDIIVVSISSKTRPGAFTHVPVDPSSPAGQGCGLLHASFVQCENVFVLDKGLVLKQLGRLSPSLMSMVGDCLKRALDLP